MSNVYLAHYGIKGQAWGRRRYQNKDGSLTPEGKKRYEGMNWSTPNDLHIRRVKVRGGGKKYGHYRNAQKEHQNENVPNPQYHYDFGEVDDMGNPITYDYSGTIEGNYDTNNIGDELFEYMNSSRPNIKPHKVKKAKSTVESIFAKAISQKISAIVNSASARLSGVDFVSKLIGGR